MGKISSNAETLNEVISFGEYKARYRSSKTFLLGFMGGLYIAIAATGNIFVNCLVGGGLGHFLGALIFPVGISLVALVGGSLFTGDALKALALIERKIKVRRFVYNIFSVWLGNFVGALFVISLCLGANLFYEEALIDYILETASFKLNIGILEAICSGFLCNLLVAGAIWLSLSTKDLVGKILAIFPPIMLFVLCGFQHIVANMYYINLGVALDTSIFDLSNYASHFLFVTIGNFLSGAIFLPAMYHLIYRKGSSKNLPLS
ncbi:MAG: formate/nitrite transporter family protein [Opitutales bacterium]